MADLDENGGEEEGRGFRAELLQSYLAFGKRALRLRWRLAALIGFIGIALTAGAVAFWPRTFTVKTVLMGLGSPVLDSRDKLTPLEGADGLILRHENLEAIIRDTDLVRTFDARRSSFFKMKDHIMWALLGEPSEKTKIGILVGTLQSKISVTLERGDLQGQLTISVDWSDGQTAAELADAARESFLRARHTAEMSAFEDKLAILETHVGSLRDEISVLADQVNAVQADPPSTAAAADPGAKPAAPRFVMARPAAAKAADPLVAEELASLKEKLASDKPKLAELESDWSKRQRDEQSKLADMKLRLTPSHPEVVTEEERVRMLSQVPTEVSSLRSEIATLEGDIKAKALLSSRPGTPVSVPSVGGCTETLPTAIMQALQKDDVDPALRAQLSGAVVKYGDLRGDILVGRIDLDTAQAAFNHRYQVVVPAEVPSKPEKPKPALILVGGLFMTLLLGLILPILLELKSGRMVERWQVHHLELPVLAELQLPRNE